MAVNYIETWFLRVLEGFHREALTAYRNVQALRYDPYQALQAYAQEHRWPIRSKPVSAWIEDLKTAPPALAKAVHEEWTLYWKYVYQANAALIDRIQKSEPGAMARIKKSITWPELFTANLWRAVTEQFPGANDEFIVLKPRSYNRKRRRVTFGRNGSLQQIKRRWYQEAYAPAQAYTAAAEQEEEEEEEQDETERYEKEWKAYKQAIRDHLQSLAYYLETLHRVTRQDQERQKRDTQLRHLHALVLAMRRRMDRPVDRGTLYETAVNECCVGVHHMRDRICRIVLGPAADDDEDEAGAYERAERHLTALADHCKKEQERCQITLKATQVPIKLQAAKLAATLRVEMSWYKDMDVLLRKAEETANASSGKSSASAASPEWKNLYETNNARLRATAAEWDGLRPQVTQWRKERYEMASQLDQLTILQRVIEHLRSYLTAPDANTAIDVQVDVPNIRVNDPQSRVEQEGMLLVPLRYQWQQQMYDELTQDLTAPLKAEATAPTAQRTKRDTYLNLVRSGSYEQGDPDRLKATHAQLDKDIRQLMAFVERAQPLPTWLKADTSAASDTKALITEALVYREQFLGLLVYHKEHTPRMPSHMHAIASQRAIDSTAQRELCTFVLELPTPSEHNNDPQENEADSTRQTAIAEVQQVYEGLTQQPDRTYLFDFYWNTVPSLMAAIVL